MLIPTTKTSKRRGYCPETASCYFVVILLRYERRKKNLKEDFFFVEFSKNTKIRIRKRPSQENTVRGDSLISHLCVLGITYLLLLLNKLCK